MNASAPMCIVPSLASRRLSDRFFSGSAAQLALRALEMEAASGEELEAIRKLLRKKSAQ